jgi:CBS domain-containing protein
MGDAAFTTEMGRYNLEANLEPSLFTGDCLAEMERRLGELTAQLREAARPWGAEPSLAGILPSLRASDLTLDSLTDRPRYHELNRTVMRLRGGAYPVYITGPDELRLTHDNVMLEAGCTSFQVHLQVGAREFARMYNAAQCAAGPVLAAAVNSPLLLGRRLWQETRIALFQHAVDERIEAQVARRHPPRVSFGEGWVRDGVLEIFREQVARFRVILLGDVDEDALAVWASGGVPALRALRMHNGSVWRWNRPCYGVTEGRPHLRIEFRALPAGPTVLDEVANAAFFLGLVPALAAAHGDIATRMRFDAAKENFFAAARHGLHAEMQWLDGRRLGAADLILTELLPLAAEGLRAAGVSDGERYLDVIRERVSTGRTGSQWALDTLAAWGDRCGRDAALVDAALRRADAPVHTWSLPGANEWTGVPGARRTVGELMSTDLFTVGPEDPAALAANVMAWRRVHHAPVEDEEGRLVGVVASGHLLQLVARGSGRETVREVMDGSPLTVGPATPVAEALALMRREGVDCLPVLDGGRLVGLVTVHDLMRVMAEMLAGAGPAAS